MPTRREPPDRQNRQDRQDRQSRQDRQPGAERRGRDDRTDRDPGPRRGTGRGQASRQAASRQAMSRQQARPGRQAGRDPDRVVVPLRRGGASRDTGGRRAGTGRAVPPPRRPRPPADTDHTERAARGTGRKSTGRKSTGGAPARGRQPARRRSEPERRPARRQPPPRRSRTAHRSEGRRRPVRRRLARLGSPGRRLRFGTLVVLLLFTVLAGRLVQLQLTDGRAYASQALKQRLMTVPLPATRGAILDRNGAVLAHSVQARYVYADPTMIKDRDTTAATLSPLLGVARSTLADKMRWQKLPDGRPLQFVYLARGLDVATGDRVNALNLPGIGVKQDEQRQVPGHDLAANLIGFTGSDLNGLTGLESAYNGLLAGKDGQREYERGNNGQEIPDGYHRETPARSGGSLRLTIDRDVQYEAQRALYDKLAASGSDMGAAVVLDTRTGAVLAQASYPTFDAADPSGSTPAQRVDQASQAVVEPGSIHKAITLGAALQSGVIKPDSKIAIPSVIYKGGSMYQDTHWHGAVKITVPGIFAYSSNVGTITVADQLGADKLYAYQQRFGLGKPTNEGMPGEASGIVQPPANWSVTSSGSIPIGLGVAVTPLQMAAAYATIANDGEYVQPHLIDGTVAADGTKKAAPAPEQHRVLSPDVARAERQAMVAVTTVPEATGLAGAIDGYQVAAKTGTGMRAVNNKYQSGQIASFIGMAPAESPRYVVAVFAHVGDKGEGANMGPVFKDIMSFTLRHYQVPPTGTPAPDFQVYG